MKKLFKISSLLLFCLIILSIGKNVEANSISKVSMDIYVDENGDAQVTETWNCYVEQGTEVYHPYYNLGTSEITNLSVLDNGTSYTTLSSWNTSGDLSSKAYKCGLNEIPNGIEICWGISNYGSHTYTVKYNISDFVSSLTDSQMIYWTLIPHSFSNTIGNVYVKIHTNFDISDSIDVWGYGDYGGTAYVYDGYIEMQSNGSLASDEYMTILVKFPSGTFNTSNKINRDFDYYYDLAQEGSTAYNEEQIHLNMSLLTFLSSFLFPVIVLIFCTMATTSDKYNYGRAGKKIPKDTPYFRDIPCKGDILRAYYIANLYGLYKTKTDLLGAIILKWVNEEKIRLEQKESGIIFKKENTIVVLNETNPEEITSEFENKLYRMLLDASGDGILENKEFEKWCRRSYNKILSWFDKIIDFEKNSLITEGLITVNHTKKMKICNRKEYCISPELRQEAEQLYGLKRYLLDYTLIPDRQAVEVKLFEQYLIFAQMLGIAKEVAKEFKELYPEIIEQSNFSSYDNIILINAWSSHSISVASNARSRAQSYSSGGGGFSSGGGGGGSFGGGGGGGGFR